MSIPDVSDPDMRATRYTTLRCGVCKREEEVPYDRENGGVEVPAGWLCGPEWDRCEDCEDARIDMECET